MEQTDDEHRQHLPAHAGSGGIDRLDEAQLQAAKASYVSLMITKRQRADLKRLGFSDEAVSVMKPAEAHKHLGL